MSFKIAIFCSLLISSAYGFNLFHIFDDPAEIAPHVDCTGLADGSKLHDPTDCGYFYLCDGGASLRLKCRSTVPYFDRCTGNCAESLDVCNVAECPGSTQAPTQAPTDGPTQAPTNAPTDAPTQAPTDAPTNAPTDAPTESTTKFVPPTVPTTCDPECDANNKASDCPCIERWTCENKQCVCSENLKCPMTNADCIKPEPDGCGCEERCDCPETDKCSCTTESIQCPFEDKAGECVKKCGCQNNCECTTAATDTTPASGCTCKATCACIEPPKVCPFKPADCVGNCACKERCLCNGDFCTCDGDNACPASFWKRH